MDSGIAFLAEVEVRTKISVEVVLTAPFTDLSKGGDTTCYHIFSTDQLLGLPDLQFKLSFLEEKDR